MSKSVDPILTQELIRGSRHHVHLSAAPDTATALGLRHGRPAILVVAAQRMHTPGHVFHRTENNVWLVAAVPPECLTKK